MKRLMFFIASCLCSFLIPGQLLASAPWPGVYEGSIKITGSDSVPLTLTLEYTDDYEKASSDQGLPVKRVMEGAFILDHEGGPYVFTKIDYDLDLSKLDLFYYRSHGGIPGAPSLRLSSHVKGGTKISGDVISQGNRNIGTFEVTRNASTTAPTISSVSRYVGNFQGTFHYDNPPDDVPFWIKIQTSNDVTWNPSDMELDYTPGHVGTFTLKTWEGALDQVYIDYLRHEVRLDYSERAHNSSLIFRALFTPEMMTGYANASFKARVGTFVVKRENK